MFAVEVFECDMTKNLIAYEKRYIERGFWQFIRHDGFCKAEGPHLLREIFVVKDRFTGADHLPVETVERYDRAIEAVSFFEYIAIVGLFCREFIYGNDRDLRIEDVTYLFADQFKNSLHFQFGGKPFLHAIDNHEFCGALLGLFEQALGFAEEASILNGGAHIRGDGFEQTERKIGKGVFIFKVLQRDASH